MLEGMRQESPSNVYITSKDIVYKFNGRDGSLLWQSPLKRPHKKHWGRDCYLFGVNGLVYAEMGYHEIVALRASNGERVWQWQCSPRFTSARHTTVNSYIFRVYPDEDRIYVHSVTEDRKVGELAALDLRTGEVSWVQTWTDAAYPFSRYQSSSRNPLYARDNDAGSTCAVCL